MLPHAHVGHYAIWLLYAIPVLIVTAAIVRSTIAQRRQPLDTKGERQHLEPARQLREGESDSPAPVSEGEVEHENVARRPPPR